MVAISIPASWLGLALWLPLLSSPQEGPPIGEVSPGLAVHLGSSDGEVEIALAGRGFRLVHGLALDGAATDRARKAIAARGFYGQVSAETAGTLARLPYADDLVNLVVADLDRLAGQAPPRAEIERVLAPGGAACLREGGRWTRAVKPRPAEMDEWTHPFYGPDESRSSADRRVGVPAGLQWVTGPVFTVAERKSSTESMVSAGGRVFMMTQNELVNFEAEAKVRPNYLVARDAFNGLLLWQRPSRGRHLGKSGAVNPRLVAAGGRLYAVEEGEVAAVDAATGRPILSFRTESFPEKFLLKDGLVLVETKAGISAFAAESGERKWNYAAAQPPAGTLAGGSTVCTFETSRDEGRFLVVLDLERGSLLWRRRIQDRAALPTSKAFLEVAFLDSEKLGLVGRESLQVFSPADGRELWSRKLADNKYRLAYLAGGLVWVADRKDVLGLDPRTGEEMKKLPSPGNLDPCAPHFATYDFVIDPRHPAAVDVRTGEKTAFDFARGGCGVGFVAANGLLYTVPNACACYKDALRGFLALTPARRGADPGEVPRLERGPAYGEAEGRPSDEDWPTYRRDPERSSGSPRALPGGLRELWRAAVGAAGGATQEWDLRAGLPVTAPVIAEGKVFLAVPNAHRVLALDSATGRPAWEFTAGGRVDAPPTLSEGLCLFGARDGWVYALRAADGRLAWRFRAAPADRRIVAFGQLESVWPALGSVLVREGAAYAAAGRAPGADGGIHLHALETRTGRQLWSRALSSVAMGGLVDLLVGGDDVLCLAGRQLDWKTGEDRQEKGRAWLRGGPAGLLEASWTRLPLGLRKGIQSWTYGKTSGQLLAWSPDRLVGYDTHSSGRTVRKSDDDVLFSEGEKGWKAALTSPMQVEAMILAGDRVWMAGPVDRLHRRTGGFLRGVALSDGRTAEEIRLGSPPVYDGLAASGGRLFMSSEDGSVACFGP
jgi:outer membrane protein assembly factor BamB